MEISTDALRALINAVAGTELTFMQVRLYKAPITLGPGLTPDDFTQADYTGYAAQNCAVAGGVYDDTAGNAVISFVGKHFQPTGSTVTNVIYGWYVTGVDGAFENLLVAAEEFPTPIPLASAMDALDVVPIMKIGHPAPAA